MRREVRKFTSGSKRKNAVRYYYYSHVDLVKFCGVDLLKSDNEARKARELAFHRDAFHANSLEQQVASVPDVRRHHSAERPYFDPRSYNGEVRSKFAMASIEIFKGS